MTHRSSGSRADGNRLETVRVRSLEFLGKGENET